jgi:hypothetical protein
MAKMPIRRIEGAAWEVRVSPERAREGEQSHQQIYTCPQEMAFLSLKYFCKQATLESTQFIATINTRTASGSISYP